jgi:hypothetical protein
MPMRIFGKEPAFYVGVLEAVIACALTFGLSQEAAVVILTLVVAVGGFLTALAAKDTLLAALVSVVKALAVLVVFLGYDWSDQKTAGIIAVVTVVAGGWLRTQTSPTDTRFLSVAAREVPAVTVVAPGTTQAEVDDAGKVQLA